MPGSIGTGERDEHLSAVAARHETPYFTDAERAAFALAIAAIRLADGGAVGDEIRGEAADHFDEQQSAALVLEIATVNLSNRLNATTRQVAGTAW
jgi:alkylhydroperoxidase family enzyme